MSGIFTGIAIGAVGFFVVLLVVVYLSARSQGGINK